MSERIRIPLAALLACLAAWIVMTSAFAQDAEQPDAAAQPVAPERASPRKLFDTFFGAINDAQKRGREERWSDVLDCLELAEGTSSDRGRRLARNLKDALDLHGFVEVEDLPTEDDVGDTSLWVLSTDGGPITCTLLADGWRFSRETLEGAAAIARRLEALGHEKYAGPPLRVWLETRAPWLTGSALGLEHWQWLGLVVLLLLCWFAHKIVGYVAGGMVAGVFRRRGWERGSEAARSAARPVGLLAIALLIMMLGSNLFLPRSPIDLQRWLVVITPKLFASLGFVLIAYRLADVVSERLAEAASGTASRLDDQLIPLVRKSLKILVTVVGALFILDNLEVDVLSLVAGVGVGALAIALAAKDTIANLFGSLTVFLDKPFQVGDVVEVSGVTGTVIEVGFRSTRLRTGYNSLVTMPNAKLVDSMIDNLGARQYRRYRTAVGVTYDTPADLIEEFCEGIRELVRANPLMRQDSFQIYLNEFSPSSLDILVNVHFEVTAWDDELRERQAFILGIIRLAERLGVSFAFPSQSLYVESLPQSPGSAS